MDTMKLSKSEMASFDETPPSGGISNVSQEDNSPINMNTPEPKVRSSRAEALIETMGEDSYSLTAESPRHTKMTG